MESEGQVVLSRLGQDSFSQEFDRHEIAVALTDRGVGIASSG